MTDRFALREYEKLLDPEERCEPRGTRLLERRPPRPVADGRPGFVVAAPRFSAPSPSGRRARILK